MRPGKAVTMAAAQLRSGGKPAKFAWPDCLCTQHAYKLGETASCVVWVCVCVSFATVRQATSSNHVSGLWAGRHQYVAG